MGRRQQKESPVRGAPDGHDVSCPYNRNSNVNGNSNVNSNVNRNVNVNGNSNGKELRGRAWPVARIGRSRWMGAEWMRLEREGEKLAG
ncbi:MAG TPA: hypothetical protein VGI16_10190 [Candidatus Acidoferrum sp.]